MILVYTHKITPRVRYIFKHILTRTLLIPVDFTSKVEEFVAFNGPKMTYTKTPLGNEFFVKSNSLLFEQGVNDMEISIQKWDEVPCFFKTGPKSSIPFDVFAASFYLITRYEEYLPHVKDIHGRYTADQSLAYKHRFLEKPVVDIWAYKLLDALKEKFPDYEYKKREYKFISTIDIDNAYAYKYKSLVRSVGGFLNDLVHLRILNVWNRFAVTFNIKNDPFDTFHRILKVRREQDVKTIFFFLIGDYTTFDTNVSASKRKYRLLIKEMVDYAKVGLHPSYFTMNNAPLLKKEKHRLEEIINSPIQRSRQHYLRFSLPDTYQNLIDLEVEEDYSMGYASNVGFRASTCTPFYFYDLDFEIQTPLKVFPFALMDTTLNDYMKLTPKQSLGRIRDIKNEVKAVNGCFITLFHNESLSDYLRWKGWKRLYESMVKIAVS
ncbi:polysaccharide deacetylase family protein [Polaribacter sp. Z014]|uniref:polysaccharide deacetylase family protein n=1 Tax=unclassified Polaribacter TaxID=196858 RepID=UPI00193C542D|nr:MULTISPECIES: polysaccharide deacetylase family protein [unclassified Polaribacter]MCL7763684.1 polysaccharide deacetylase family protein [Polaribacter sp. Z014]QVY65350.1 polysaccharide deacetylase family protein [Polaribacter sp. Q13]